MVSWSSLLRPAVAFTQYRSALQNVAVKNALQHQLRQYSSHGFHLDITPSRYQWNKFKDLLHFYVMLGLIPITGIILYSNIMIGPAQLSEIPKDYEPEHWEYHKHPITRFMARYIYGNPQEDYEKALHYYYEENEKAQIRLLEKKVLDKMAERNDYKAYYYRPAIAKYHRVSKQAAEGLEALRGD